MFECNHIGFITLSNFKKGARCNHCKSEKLRIIKRDRPEDVYANVKLAGFKFIKWVDDYCNGDSKFILKCVKEHNFESTNDKLRMHIGCPTCSSSKGERIIEQLLNKYNLKYVRQKRFTDCKRKNTLPFDFAIFDKSNEIKFLIEFDGKQHDIPIKYFGGEMGFEKTKEADRIKNEYCIKNNYRLIRIKSMEINKAESILQKELERKS